MVYPNHWESPCKVVRSAGGGRNINIPLESQLVVRGAGGQWLHVYPIRRCARPNFAHRGVSSTMPQRPAASPSSRAAQGLLQNAFSTERGLGGGAGGQWLHRPHNASARVNPGAVKSKYGHNGAVAAAKCGASRLFRHPKNRPRPKFQYQKPCRHF